MNIEAKPVCVFENWRESLNAQEQAALWKCTYAGPTGEPDPYMARLAQVTLLPAMQFTILNMLMAHMLSCSNWFCQSVIKRGSLTIHDLWVYEMMRLNGNSDFFIPDPELIETVTRGALRE